MDIESGLLSKRQKTWASIGIFLILLFLMIALQFDVTTKSRFEESSEALVESQMFAQDHGIDIAAMSEWRGGLGTLFAAGYVDYSTYYQNHTARPEFEGEMECSYLPYTSQVGLQGLVFGWLSRFFPESVEYWLFRGACTGAVDLILLLICWLIKRRYGIMMAGCWLLVCTVSPWIINFAPNLYWVEFTWFLPMLLGLLCLSYPRKRFLWYPLIYLSIVLKTMCGYEYISTITVASVSFICAEWFVHKEDRKKLTRMILCIGVMCLLGFATTLCIHGWLIGNGNIAEGVRDVIDNIALRRTWGDSGWGTAERRAETKKSLLAVLATYFWGRLAGKATLIVYLLTAAALVWQRRAEHKQDPLDIALLLVNILGAMSWYILAKQHSYVHINLCFVLWHMGSMQTAIYILAKFLWEHRSFVLRNWGPAVKETE